MQSFHLYARLKRIERDGFVTGSRTETSGGLPRTEYSLTPLGEKRLDVWLNTPKPSAGIRRIRTKFFSRLYIAQALGRSTTTLWTRQILVCETELTGRQTDLKESRSEMEKLTQEFVIAQLRAIIVWLYHSR